MADGLATVLFWLSCRLFLELAALALVAVKEVTGNDLPEELLGGPSY